MATKHWVRDVPLSDPNNYIANGNHMQANAVLYNFLKVAGWEQVWECDGERTQIEDPNHVPDGDVQDPGTSQWTAYNGATISKDTTKVHSGVRSLKVVASALSQGVETDPLHSMRDPSAWVTGSGDSIVPGSGRDATYNDSITRFDNLHVGDYLDISGDSIPGNNGTFPITKFLSANSISFENPSAALHGYYDGPFPPPPDTASFKLWPYYQIVVWAATDVAFDVDVDFGDGTYNTVGTIPANGGVFTRYQFDFWRISSLTESPIRFVSAAAGTLYIGGIHVFSSVWDMPTVIKRGTDGIITNPDQFSTAGSFTPDASDIGKTLFVWDGTNNKNSGAYPITAVAAGVCTLDLRSGSAALTSQSGLRWRIVQIDHLNYPASGIPDKLQWAGFGFESIHTSGWRFFMRQSQENGQTGKGTILWSAPEDTDFNFSTGEFYKSGPSVQRYRQGPWIKIPDSASAQDEHLWRGPYTYFIGTTTSRCFLMTDEDGAFIAFFLHDGSGSNNGCHLHGYLGSTLPGIQSHYLFARWEQRGVANECYFDDNGNRFAHNGTTYDSHGLAIPCLIGQLGIGTSDADVTTQANAGTNPWSGNEWKRPLILWRDREMIQQEAALQVSDCGIYQGRANMVDLSTFDSENFLHLSNGFIWEWSGETLV